MRRRKKPTFDEWMHFLQETKKLRAKQQEGIKTPVIVMIRGKKAVKDGFTNDCGN